MKTKQIPFSKVLAVLCFLFIMNVHVLPAQTPAPVEPKSAQTPAKGKPSQAVVPPVNTPVAAKPKPPSTNCFRLFDVNATGRNDVNAYLLSLLMRWVYGDQLANDIRKNDVKLEAVLVDNAREFTKEFTAKTKNYFYDPSADDSAETAPRYWFVFRNDSKGLDPEAMVVGTANAVYVIFRGTDRVAKTNKITHAVGEWIMTDARARLVSPCNGCAGKVHNGFYTSLHYNHFLDSLIAKVKQFGGEQKKIWITGHSLGGAHAQLFAFFLTRHSNMKAQGIYVFASPHSGDPEFAAALNKIYPQGRLQRFEFVDDMVTMLPLRNIGYGRAGIRNHFSKENPPGNYFFNTEERKENNVQFTEKFYTKEMDGDANFCFHHQAWYVRSCYNNLSADMKSKLPNPPKAVNENSSACNQFQVNLGKTGNRQVASTIQKNMQERRENRQEKIQNVKENIKGKLNK